MVENIKPLGQLKSPAQLQLEHAAAAPSGSAFTTLLKSQLEKSQGVQFSKHAAQRVEQRGIEITDSLLKDINQAVDKAGSKGAKDVVIISSKGAFIVNVPNKTIVTTMSENEMKENVFTNIDSAVLV